MQIHPTAIVHPSAQLGAECEVGPGAIIEADVVLGPRCVVGPRAFVGRYTHMGADNALHIGAVVGYTPQDLKFDPETVSHCRVGNGNEFREYTVVHRSARAGDATIVGDRCFLMNHAHLGHDVKLGNDVIVGASGLLAGFVEVDDRAFISGNTAVHQFCRVGRIAMLRGLSGVSKDVPPFCIADFRNTLRGLNSVGLQRAGFDADTRMALKEVFKMLFRSGLPLADAAREVEETPHFEVPEVVELVTFCRTSKRGIVSWMHSDLSDGSDDEWLSRARFQAEAEAE